MGLISMASVRLTIRQKHKHYKSIEIPLQEGGGGGLEINSENTIFVFICHHQIGEKIQDMRGTKNSFKHIINIKLF